MLTRAGLDRDVDIHLLLEQAARIGCDDPGDDRAGVGIDRRGDVLDRAVERAGAVAGIDLGRIVDADLRQDRSVEICASTQTCERLATVNAGEEPAWSSCPGVICLSTTIPETGARMTPAETRRRASRHAPRDRAAIDAHRDQRLQRGVAVRLGARRVGLGLRRLALGNAVVGGKVAVGVGEPSRVRGGRRRPCDRRRRPWQNPRTATSASGWPLATGWPSATKIRVTGPVNGDTTEVA